MKWLSRLKLWLAYRKWWKQETKPYRKQVDIIIAMYPIIAFLNIILWFVYLPCLIKEKVVLR